MHAKEKTEIKIRMSHKIFFSTKEGHSVLRIQKVLENIIFFNYLFFLRKRHFSRIDNVQIHVQTK